MTRSRTLFALLVVALLALSAVPVGAARSSDPRAARDAARARRAQAAAELNTIKASEGKLLEAAGVLQDQVLAQAARVDAARQAVAAANAELAEATASLQETEGEIGRLNALVVERAVSTFMSPRGVDPTDMGDTRDLAASTRKQALLHSVAASDEDVIDQLNAAEEDYALAKVAAAAAKQRAEGRKAETEARLAQLERDRANAKRLADAAAARAREVLAEIDAHSRSESELTRIIEERARAEAARAAAAAAARPSGGGGGGADAGSGGSSARSGGCIWPSRGRVTSEYGSRWGRLHAGIDIGAPTGTPIWAAKSGTVIFAGQQSGYGNVVIIDHGGGMTTVYAHQSRIATRDGASVGQGSTIGYVGNTGRSTGPHLHFETRYGGSPRNPRGCLG